MKTRYVQVGVVVLGCSIGANALGQTDVRGRVEGTNHFTSSPFPVSQASVQLRDRNGQVVGNYQTGGDGFYYFRGIRPGSYSLRVNDRTNYAVTIGANRFQDLPPVRLQF
jgi:hypothetical protein